MTQERAVEHTEIARLSKKTRKHLSGLAHIANTMPHEITHYARPVIHMTYMHAYCAIMSARQHKVARSMFNPLLKSICLARRQPIGWDQPDCITLTDPDQIPVPPSQLTAFHPPVEPCAHVFHFHTNQTPNHVRLGTISE